MDKFETIGCNRQLEATTKEWAIKQFAMSCDFCCRKGRNVRCDGCAIDVCHKYVCAYFDDMEAKKASAVRA